MTMNQKSQKFKIKPLTNALGQIFLATLTILSIHDAALAANLQTAPSNTSTTTNSSITSPTTPASTTTTPSTATSTTTTTMTTTAPNPDAPITQANLSDSALLNWAMNAAKLAYSYDFKNYASQVQQNQPNFTSQGWTAFKNALDKSNNLQVVQSRKLVASATPTGKATIVSKGVKNGVYVWNVQLPMLATYESESRFIKQNLLINMLIARNQSSPNGVAISHFMATLVPAAHPPITSAPGSATKGPNTAGSLNSMPSTSTSNPMSGGGTMPSSSAPLPYATPAPSTTTTTSPYAPSTPSMAAPSTGTTAPSTTYPNVTSPSSTTPGATPPNSTTTNAGPGMTGTSPSTGSTMGTTPNTTSSTGTMGAPGNSMGGAGTTGGTTNSIGVSGSGQ